MTGEALLQARLQAGLSQVEAARRLRVSQTLFSLMEKGKRSITPPIAAKAVRVFEASPVHLAISGQKRHTDNQLAVDLAALGYPGFAHLGGKPRNPAEVLLDALDRDNLDARVLEALPWLPLRYSEMDWNWLVSQAKLRNLQNRLGFILAMAARIARISDRRDIARRLYEVVRELKDARLAKSDTLCQSSWPPVQRKHARQARSKLASYWNLDTCLTEKDLAHVSA